MRLGCGGDSYFPAVVQSATQIPVYVFYLSSQLSCRSSRGGMRRSRWRPVVTRLQLGQFVVLLVFALLVLRAGTLPAVLPLLQVRLAVRPRTHA